MHFDRSSLLTAALAGAAGLLACSPEVAQAQRACRVAEVTVSPPDATFGIGTSYPFIATAYDNSGVPCENPTFRWSSNSPGVASISSAGIATGLTVGTATVTARVGVGAAARSGTAVVTVSEQNAGTATAGGISQVPGYNPRTGRPTGPGWAAADRQPDGTGPAENLIVDPLQLTLVRGESRYLDFRAVRADGSNGAPLPVVFSVDAGGENAVSVDTLGLISSRGDAGSATVRLTMPGQLRIQPKVVRVEVRADTVRFNRPTLSLTPGAIETLSIFIPSQSRALNPGGLFQFLSSDTTRLRVNPAQPIIEARTPGTARIIAQSGLYADITATVNIHRRVASLRLEPVDSIRTIAIGGATSVRAVALAADGTPITEVPLTWRSADSVVASFDAATGAVRGRRAGEALITVFAPTGRDSAISRTVRIRVVSGGLAIASNRIGMNVNERVPLAVSLLDDQRRPVMSANEYLAWTTSADSVARLEGHEVIAMRPGRARITGRAAWDSTVVVDVLVGGEMAAVNQRAGRWDLAMYWGNGANWKPLTADSLVESQPAWSPDLTRLAYVANLPTPANNNRTPPRSALWAMNVDGSEPVRLTDDSAQARYPSWVRGVTSRIVFEWNKGGLQQVWLYEFPASGTGRGTLRAITATPVANLSPGVAPAGDRITYVSLRQSSPGRSTFGLYTAGIDGSDERLLTSAPPGQRIDQPQYSPDGRAILFLRTDPGRQQAQRVYRFPLNGSPADSASAVTPVGVFVRAFSQNADGTVLALNTLEQGSNNRQIARTSLFTIASGASAPLATAAEDELSSAVLRPAAAPAQNR